MNSLVVFILLPSIGAFIWTGRNFLHTNAWGPRESRLHAESNDWWSSNEVQLTGIIGDSPRISVPNNGDNWRDDSDDDDDYDDEYDDYEEEDESRKVLPIPVNEEEERVAEQASSSSSSYGDFVVSAGSPPPIDVDAKMNSYMNSEQMTQLLTAVNSVDPVQASLGYQESLPEICAYFGLSVERALEICEQQGIELPYGAGTVLHAHLAEKVRQAIGFQDD
eukprot:gene43141-52730_t